MATKHNLQVDVPFTLRFADGTKITAEVRLRGYGAPNGMILVSEYSLIEKRTDEIVQMRYGYSCFSQPSEDEIDSDEGLSDILDDWEKNKEE